MEQLRALASVGEYISHRKYKAKGFSMADDQLS
jgi:hypothetical protein